MNRSCSNLGLFLVVLLLAGCTRAPDETATIKPVEISAAEAKQALLGLDSQSFPSFVMIPLPQDEEMKVFNSGEEFALGVWRGNLKQKTFSATTHYPNADHHAINQASGVFEQNGKGEWVAKVTDTASATAAH